MRAKDTNSDLACAFARSEGSVVRDTVFSHAGVGLLHRDAVIIDLPVVHVGEKHWGDIFAVGIEYHLAGDAMIAGRSRQRVANAAFVEAGATYSVEQDLHLVIR